MAAPDSHQSAAPLPAGAAVEKQEPAAPSAEPEGAKSSLAGGIIKYYRVYTLAVAGLLIFGIWSFVGMPRAEDPEFDVADIQIVTLFPGALASKVESLVTRPVEEAVEEMDDIKTITSQSLGGLSLVRVTTDDHADPARVTDEIEDKIKEIRADLPPGVREPEVFGFNTADIPILLLSLYGPDDYRVLDRWAEFLDDELSTIPDVAEVTVEGLPERQIVVEVDGSRLSQYGIPLIRLRDILSQENAAIPGGKFDVGARRYLLKNPNEYESLDDVRDTVVGSHQGSVVFLRDLARVEDSYEEGRYRIRTNGRPALVLAVLKRDQTNTIEVAAQVRAEVEELRAVLPPDLETRVVSDRGVSVEQLLGSLQSNALSGGAIVILMVTLFLGVRQAIIVSISIPLAVLIAFILMQRFSIDLNQISIFGLVLALGMLVDASLVVVENIDSHLEKGKALHDAVTTGTGEVTLSVINSTLTTVAAFVPMLFMVGDIGRFIYSMPMTLTFAMFGSTVVALTVVPLLYYAIWRSRPPAHSGTEHEWPFVGRYVEFAKLALRHRLAAVLFATAALALAVFTIPRLGLQFFPKAEKSFFMINVRLPREANFATADLVARQVERILESEQQIRDYTTHVGKGGPRVYYNVERENEKPNYAQVLVNLEEDFSGSVDEYVAELQGKLARISGGTVEPKVLEQGPTTGAPIQVRLSGASLETLAQLATEAKARIADVPGVSDLRDDMGDKAPQLDVDLDKQRAGLVGVNAFSFSRTIFMALNGEVATQYRESGEEIPLVVRLDPGSLEEVSDLRQLYLPTTSGGVVPFGEVAAVREVADFAQINRRDGQRTVTVESDVRGRLVSQVVPEVQERLRDLRLEPGYSIAFGGESEERDESFAALGRAMGLALLIIYSLLAIQFNSFVQPVVILITVPFGIVGAVAGLFITGRPFGFMAFIGIVGLCGVVINDSILLTDVANYLQRVRGLRQFEALIEAGRSRLRPVVITSVTTIAGLLPMAVFGGSLWSPLAVALSFGLATSTFLILVLLPVIYSLLVRPKEGARAFRVWPRLRERLFRREIVRGA